MLPTHGTVTSVFHLANSIRHMSQPDIATWVSAANSRSSFLAAAIDHRPAAEFLLGTGLAVSAPAITPSARLRAVSRRADRPTLIAIAGLLLVMAPPPWLSVAVVKGEVRHEFVPTGDLAGLAWLRPQLDQLLVGACHRPQDHSEVLALGIGRAAELVMFAALDQMGAFPVHVSEISDRFGYDIETLIGNTRRWEVKGCTIRTRDSFHLSRNEFEQCRRYPEEWRLVQVVFEPEALTANALTRAHVSIIRELPSAKLLSIPPPESDEFYWEASARIVPPTHSWAASRLAVPADLRLSSIVTLGEESLESRATFMQGGRELK